MKIGLIVPGGVDRTGIYRIIPALLALISRLSERHEVHVFALRQEDLPDRWSLRGAHIHNIGVRFTYLRAIRAIRAEHQRAPFKVLHAIWSGAPGFVAVVAGRTLRVPSAIHVAGGELAALRDIGYGGSLSWRGRLREAAVLRAATAVTAASQPMIQALAARGIAATRIPLGADCSVWQPREPRRRSSAEAPRLVHVASLNRVKDQTTLLQALALLIEGGFDFRMDIIGEDTLHGEIQALSRSLQLDRCVRFHGFLTQQQIQPLVASAQLLVISSRHEAGPLAVLEAAVLGVPTVGTQVGHIAEWASQAALCVPTGDPAALAQSIGRVLSDEDLRIQLAFSAFWRATQEDADFTAQSFLALYDAMISSRCHDQLSARLRNSKKIN